jgi:hypothetical protein
VLKLKPMLLSNLAKQNYSIMIADSIVIRDVLIAHSLSSC